MNVASLPTKNVTNIMICLVKTSLLCIVNIKEQFHLSTSGKTSQTSLF